MVFRVVFETDQLSILLLVLTKYFIKFVFQNNDVYL